MNLGPTNVDQWKACNSDDLVQCRWGCTMTRKACHAYQTRTNRYVIHFNGSPDPQVRVNAEYIRCFLPEPCSYLLSDDEAMELRMNRVPPIEDKA